MPRKKGPSLDRSQVVDAAIALIEREGPDALGMSRLARELQIRPPSLYNHLANADDLNFAILLEGNRRLLEVWRVELRDVYEPREALLTLALSLRRWALSNRRLYQLMSRVPPQNEHPDYAPLARDMLELFRRPLAQLAVRGDDAIHAARSVRAAMHGYVLLEGTGQFRLGQDTETSYRWLMNTLLRGLAASEP